MVRVERALSKLLNKDRKSIRPLDSEYWEKLAALRTLLTISKYYTQFIIAIKHNFIYITNNMTFVPMVFFIPAGVNDKLVFNYYNYWLFINNIKLETKIF